MNIQEKLQLIQKLSRLTQTQIAQKINVSFVAFNNWWTGKSTPRKKQQLAIDELYREYTGQKQIPETILLAKKRLIIQKSKGKNILKKIIFETDIYDRFMLDLTYNSNRIEGSTLSENETAAILFHNKALPDRSLIEQLEAKNHQTALEYLFDYLYKKKRINESLILKIHSILMNGIGSDAGNYRSHGVRILGSNVPIANYLKVPDLMKKIVNDINKQNKDMIDQASVIHSRFEQVHPFADGNGRIGRLLMNAMLLKNNIPPAVIKQEDKQLYYTCLNKSQLKNDNSQLQDFICDAILDGYKIIDRK